MRITDTAMAEDAAPSRDEPQALVGFRTNAEWAGLVTETAERIEALEAIADEATRTQVFDALAAVDAVHREALHRLVRLFKEGVLEQVVTDPAINTLMGMYGLLPEKTPGCRKVWDFLGAAPPPEAVAAAVAADPATMPPHWSPTPAREPPASGETFAVRMDEGSFVLASTAGQLFAFDAICPHHGKPMNGGELSRFAFVCPHGPGCIYDVRDGARLGGGAGVACHPVRVGENGRPQIGFGMPFTPNLPAF